MAFNTDRFDQAQFSVRTIDIKVPELVIFFDEGEDAVWQVRGLTGHELSKVNEAVKMNKDVASILSGITSELNSDKIDAIKESLGLSSNAPDDLVRRIATLKAGSVAPNLSQELCVKLSDAFPTLFYLLTNKIFELTGEGKMLGESNASGEIAT